MKRHSTILLLSLLLPYIAAADIPEGYYKNADGKKKDALKAALHDIIQPVTVLAYGSGEGKTWTGFYTTDRIEETNQVIDRYSYDVRYFPESASASAASAVSGMNIEHSFPKSWWGGTNNTAYKDLFNLMPCEQKINSSKSNYAMGRVTSVKTTNGCTKVGTGTTSQGTSAQLWEPADEWKGDFARDYFYMVTTYSDLTWTSNGLDMLEQSDWPTLKEWAYTLFLEWARQDPVDEIEMKRNDAVYSIQKNRNPFVDFPNLAEYVWGDSTDYAFSVGSSSSGGGGNHDDDITPDFATLVDCTMRTGLSPFVTRASDGSEGKVWTSDATYGAKATANKLPNYEADEYLMVSLDLTNMQKATLTFDHATGFNKTRQVKDVFFQVLVSDDYDGVPEDATWELLEANFPPLPSSSNYTSFVSSGDISLDTYCGQELVLAFRFISTKSDAYCWEVRNVKVTAQTDPDALPFISSSPTLSEEDAATYDLMGRRVPWNTKGIVIRNGRKILQTP